MSPQENGVPIPVYEPIQFFPKYAGKPQWFVGLYRHLDQVLTLFEENFGENVPVWRSGGKHQVAFLAKQKC